MNAETGEIENEKYIGKISLLSKKDLENKRGNNYIEVLIIDLFDDYRECINNCLNTAINKECSVNELRKQYMSIEMEDLK